MVADVSAFQARPEGETRRLGSSMAADAALVFSYRNAAGRSHLLIFGVGQDGRIYWYHPQWQDPARPPLAIAAQQGPQSFALTTAVRHPIVGERLTLHALLLDEAPSVQDVERRLAEAHGEVGTLFSGAQHWPRSQSVER